jgi:AAA15 family ATPase/GTPase
VAAEGSREVDSRMQRMIEELTLKFGSSPSEPPLQFSPGPVTVFVGPNNSGKSLLLREVEAFSELDDTPASPTWRRSAGLCCPRPSC